MWGKLQSSVVGKKRTNKQEAALRKESQQDPSQQEKNLVPPEVTPIGIDVEGSNPGLGSGLTRGPGVSFAAASALQEPRGMGIEGIKGVMPVSTTSAPDVKYEEVSKLTEDILRISVNNNLKSTLLSELIEELFKKYDESIGKAELATLEKTREAEAAQRINDNLRAQIQTLTVEEQEKIAAIESEKAELKKTIAENREAAVTAAADHAARVVELESQCSLLDGKCQNAESAAAQSAAEITSLTEELRVKTATNEADTADLRRQLTEAENKHNQHLEELNSRLAEATSQSSVKDIELQQARAAVQDITSRFSQIQEENSSKRDENTRLTEENAAKMSQIAAINQSVAALTEQKDQAEAKLKIAKESENLEKQKCKKLEVDITTLKQALEKMKGTKDNLEKILSEMKTKDLDNVTGKMEKTNSDALLQSQGLLEQMAALKNRVQESQKRGGGRKKTRKKKNKKKRNSTKRIVFKTKKQNKKTRIKKVKKMNRKPAKKLTRKRK